MDGTQGKYQTAKNLNLFLHGENFQVKTDCKIHRNREMACFNPKNYRELL